MFIEATSKYLFCPTNSPKPEDVQFAIIEQQQDRNYYEIVTSYYQ